MIDSPSVITYHHLNPWLHGNLILVDLTFNFEDLENDFESNLNNMIDRFDGGDLKEWTQFLIVITTHSDPRTGDLHIAPDNAGSVPVNEVSNIFLLYFILLILLISKFQSRSFTLCFQNVFKVY